MENQENATVPEDSAISGMMMYGESPIFASNGTEDGENRKEMQKVKYKYKDNSV